MEIKADVKLDARSLNRFLIYHNYMRVSGIIGLVLSLAAIAALCLKWGLWTTTQRCLLVVLALLFTVLQPLMLVSIRGCNTVCHGGVPDPIPLLLS